MPVPIPADLVMIVLGERVSAGALPLWLVLIALQLIAVTGTLALYWIVRGPGAHLTERLGPRLGLTPERVHRVQRTIERRGVPAVALGRSTLGLRTATVVVSAGTPDRRRMLIALVLGSTLFVQGHFLLGLALGPAARALFETTGTIAIALIAVILATGAVFWIRRRGRDAGMQAFGEACCPACIALGALAERGGGTLRG